MKKILAFLLVAIMVVALVACNSGSGTTTTATDKVETTEATTVVTTEATTQATTQATTVVTTEATTEATTQATTEVTTVETTEATTEATTEVTTEETTTEETTTAVVIDPNDVDAILTAAYALKDGEALTGEFTLEGVVTKVGTAYSAQYQNVTFTIAVEGQEARPIDAYRAKGEGADTVKVGDTVKVTGKIKNYKGTIEFDAGCTMVITKVFVEEPKELEGIICDIDFKGGKMVDSKGLLTFPSAANEYVDNYSVYVDGTKYKVPAFVVFEMGTAAVGTLTSVKSNADYLSLFSKDFTVEVYYFNNNTSGGDSVQAIFCGTEFGGWGIAENAGKPYFIIGLNNGGKNSYASVYATDTSSNKELTHVVAVFSKSTGVMSIYINGVLDATASFSGALEVMPPNTADTLNKLVIGADIDGDKNLHNPDDLEFRTADFQLVDAKIYNRALTAEEVAVAYQLDKTAVTG